MSVRHAYLMRPNSLFLLRFFLASSKRGPARLLASRWGHACVCSPSRQGQGPRSVLPRGQPGLCPQPPRCRGTWDKSLCFPQEGDENSFWCWGVFVKEGRAEPRSGLTKESQSCEKRPPRGSLAVPGLRATGTGSGLGQGRRRPGQQLLYNLELYPPL